MGIDIQPERLKTLRVLYVEDDAETREELELVLKSWFPALFVAKDGQEGLKLYKESCPDIVITDIQMPNMNGLGLSEAIKAINPDQCIIFLSAYNDVDYLFKALELGIQHYITKPVNINKLLSKLSQIAEQMTLEIETQRYRKLLEQYKLLVDEKAIVCKFNLTGHITYINQQFSSLSGYEKTELIGHSGILVCESESHFAHILARVSTGQKWTGILKNKTKSGDHFVVDASIVAILNEKNETEEYVALMVDITELYDRHERLALNLKNDLIIQTHLLNEYEQALELGTSLCVINPEGRIVSANRNFCTSLECNPEDLIGQSFASLIPDYKNFQERVFDKVHRQGYDSRVLKFRYNNQSEKTLSTIIVAIHDIDGQVHSMLGLSQDITESVRLTEEIMDTQKELLYVMGEVVENRSQETGKHVKRVAELSMLLALKSGLTDEHAEMIKMASPMHDVGKVGISDKILHKPGKLTEDEFEVMKTHAALGYNLLKKMDKPLIKMAANIAHQHHERFDGTGYPRGLKADQISIEGRIVALVDVFDALSSQRAYKKPWSPEAVIEYINNQRGKQFDPELVDIMLKNIEEVSFIRNLYQD